KHGVGDRLAVDQHAVAVEDHGVGPVLQAGPVRRDDGAALRHRSCAARGNLALLSTHHPPLRSAAICASRLSRCGIRSWPQNCSVPTKKVGAPNTWRAWAASFAAASFCFIAGSWI